MGCVCLFLCSATFGIMGSDSPSEPAPMGELAFSSVREGNSDIYVVNADGTDLRRVTTQTTQELEPSWSPDGSKMAYQSRRPSWRLFTAQIDGEDEIQITTPPSWSPSWSPNGEWIAYSTGTSLVRVKPNGTGSEVLIQGSNCGRPAWSPDGSALAFHCNRSGNHEIYVLRLETGELTQVTDHAGRDVHCSWSPDGQRLAFASDRDGDLEIYTIHIDGTGLVRLTDNQEEDMLPSWSPDGEWLAFTSDRDGNFEIYLLKPDGSQTTRLTDNPGDDMYPAWRPRIEQQANGDGTRATLP